MNALEIIAILIILLITVGIIIKLQKKCSEKKTPISPVTSPEPAKPKPSADQPVADVKPTVTPPVPAAAVRAPEPATPQTPQAAVVSAPHTKPIAKPQVTQTTASLTEKDANLLPQDSVLRRHFLSHLYTMIEALSPPRPTDSVLLRHYDTMMVAKIDQCLNNKQAMEQLIADYEHQK